MISCSCDLVITLHDSYSSKTSHVHYIHITPCTYDLLVHDLSSRLFLLLLLLSVFDTAKHFVLIISMPYWTVTVFSYSLFYCLFLSSCTLVGPLLTDLYYFSVFRSESQYRELIVENILVSCSPMSSVSFFDLSY